MPAAQLGLLSRERRTIACAGNQALDAVSRGSIAKALAATVNAACGPRGELVLDTPPTEGMPIAFEDGLLHLGPFLPRTG